MGDESSSRLLRRVLLTSLLVASVLSNAGAFQLSMSSRSFGERSRSRQQKSPFRDPFSAAASALVGGVTGSSPSKPFDISSSLISQLAVMALKRRLAGHTSVTCDVPGVSPQLLFGKVGPVTVSGTGWQSGLGLTCRAIEATVDTCELDIQRVVAQQKLSLIRPARGKAMIALNAADFGNFITHPLIKSPTIPVKNGQQSAPIKFKKEGTDVDAETGVVTFFVESLGMNWQCELRRGTAGSERGAVVSAVPVSETGNDETAKAKAVGGSLTRFFNEIEFDLDGTSLSFRDMQVTGKGKTPSLMLSLNICVRKFPSPGLEF